MGIDLCRGIAAYAVVLVHSGDETWGLPISDAAIQFRLMFYFAVPFFLIAAFYFLTRKPTIDISSKFWKSRIQRIVIPYAIWSVIYLIIRSLFFLVSDKQDRLVELFQDPIALFLFGGASYQLYFLPLLLAGTSLLLVAKYLNEQKAGLVQLVALALGSIVVNEIIHITGNSFRLGDGIAFASVLEKIPDGIEHAIARIIFVELAWMIKCLPYVFTALALHRFLARLRLSERRAKILSIIFLVLFLLTTTAGKVLLPHSLQEILVASFLLLAGIFASGSLRDSSVVESVGACSFGIYLIHPIPMNFVKMAIVKIFPALSQQVSVTSMLIFSISSFILSWLIVSIVNRKSRVNRYLFGM